MNSLRTRIFVLLTVFGFGFGSLLTGALVAQSATVPTGKASNPGATAAANSVLNYIAGLSDPARNDNRVIVGQFGAYGEGEDAGTARDSLQRIYDQSGKWPAMTGMDYATWDLWRLNDYSEPNGYLIEQWNRGSLVTVSWHTPNPWTGGSASVEYGSWDFRSVRPLTQPGSTAYNNYMQLIDSVAGALAQLRDAGVVVIWRPFHEMNGAWFWWHQQTKEDYAALWQHMYNYFTYTKGLNNLLWAYSPNVAWDEWATRVDYYYPGDQYVDIVGMDVYNARNQSGVKLNDYSSYTQMAALNKPMGLLEFGPSPASGAGWQDPPYDYTSLIRDIRNNYPKIVFFQAWEWIWQIGYHANVSGLMNDPWAVSLDDLPNFKSGQPIPTNTAVVSNPTKTFTATYTRTPLPTATLTKTSTPIVATATKTRTPVPPTKTPTKTATKTATVAASKTNVPPTKTLTRTPTKTKTPTFTPSKTYTPSRTPQFTPSKTATKTATKTFTPSKTATKTATKTLTKTATKAATKTATKTGTPVKTATKVPTKTLTKTATLARTATKVPTRTPTRMSGNPTLTPVASVTPVDDGKSLPSTFYRGININGNPLTLDGNAWEGLSAPNVELKNGNVACKPTVALNPATDAARAAMLRCYVSSTNLKVNVWGIPQGYYYLYIYVWEDDAPSTFTIIAQAGQAIVPNYQSGTAGTWKKLGPLTMHVESDGGIKMETFGGPANFSGLEIRRINSAGSGATPTATSPVPAGTPLPLTVVMESDAQPLARMGNWTVQETASASGGSYLYTSAGNITFKFTGTQFDVLYVQHKSLGRFGVEVDGVQVLNVQTNNSLTKFKAQAQVRNLAPGTHTVRIYPLYGTIAIDALVVDANTTVSAP
jgi:mannan endo-1,4-beta-mannosidase